MRITPLLDRTTVVLIGNFNPAIFSPAWLALNDLIGRGDADKATVQTIFPEACQFEVGQFNVFCDLQRFIVSCETLQHEMIRDLVIGTFGKVLSHTPIAALGINREVHFGTPSFEVRNAVGKRLAPADPWGDWGQSLNYSGREPVESNGLVSITVRETKRLPERGHVQAILQPSALPQLINTGIFMQINRHLPFDPEWSTTAADQLIAILDTEWTQSIDKAEFIIEQIQRLVEGLSSQMGARN